MKVKLSLLAGAALLASAAGAFAQSAVTDPVGYITLNVSAGAAGTPAASYIGASLVNKVDFAGAYTGSGAKTLTFAASTFTAGAFDAQAGIPQYYVEVTSGANAGVWTDIVSNTADTLTLLDDISTLAGASGNVTIRKHHTISTLFGATNTAGFQAGVDLGSSDELQIIDATTQTQTTVYFSTDDLNPGWVTAGGQPAAGLIVAPGVGIKVTRKATTALPIVQVGYVKTGPTILPVEQGLNVVSVPLATEVTLDASNLVASGLTGGIDLNAADEIGTLSNGAFTTTYFSLDDLNPGWVTAAGTPAGTTPLAGGSAFRVLRKTAAFNWKAPAQTIAN